MHIGLAMTENVLEVDLKYAEVAEENRNLRQIIV
jgi:hypothetical protein